MNRFIYWLQNFMRGRYGNDALNIALFVLYLFFSLITNFLRFTPLWPLFYVNYIFLVLIFARMLSRNIPARSRENQVFMRFFGPVKNYVINQYRHSQDRYHRYYRCPKCRHQLRVPRGRGKICITCPTCGHEFIKKLSESTILHSILKFVKNNKPSK